MTIDDYINQNSTPEDDVLKELNRETHLKILAPRMLSGNIQGKLLESISKMIQPKTILELGTYTGYSAICMAKGLSPNGVLHTIEINDELESIIRKYIKKVDFESKIKLHIGDALTIIPSMEMEFDLVFIDADKRLYSQYYDLVIDKLKPGGFIIADNVLWGEKVIEAIQQNDLYTKGIVDFNNKIIKDNRVENFILPLRDGISIIRKKTT
ncbi:MAG: O-methyltransferase [Bacteroidales bacterium]|nr:O-methyltransferase [Bacteroidales bacterium]